MTIKDIARLSGYAVGTVSRVLNDRPDASPAAREKIMAVVEAYNFKLNSNAKHLKQQAYSGVAIIVKGTQNMLFASIIERLQELIKARGYLCLIYYIDEDNDEVEQAIQVSRERKPRGIVFLGSNPDFFRAQFVHISVPCILISNSAADLAFPNLSSVCTDDGAAAARAVEYLIALGHRQIGVLGGSIETSSPSGARFAGCLRVFNADGIDFDTARQYEITRFEMKGGYRAMGRLLEKMPELTAVFAMSDVQAVGAIRALHERGLSVPEDISVVGFDGIALGDYFTPQLTTIQQDARHMADRGMEILFEHIAADIPPVHELVPFRLKPGESAGALTPSTKG